MAYGNIMGQTPQIDASNLQLDASQIVSGQFATSQIPSLNASKITSGTFSTSRIPNLSASKITSGILPVARGGTGVTSYDDLKTQLGINGGGGGYETIASLNNLSISTSGGETIDVHLSNSLNSFQEMYVSYAGRNANSNQRISFENVTALGDIDQVNNHFSLYTLPLNKVFWGMIHFIWIDSISNLVLVNGSAGSNVTLNTDRGYYSSVSGMYQITNYGYYVPIKFSGVCTNLNIQIYAR